MGTRFIATKEAPVHDNVKQAIIAASELDTRLVMRPLRNTERVLNNAAVERLLVKERELGDAITIQDILPEVAGVYPKIMTEGAMDEGAWSCGMVAGLIHDIPTCQELIDPDHAAGRGGYRPDAGDGARLIQHASYPRGVLNPGIGNRHHSLAAMLAAR